MEKDVAKDIVNCDGSLWEDKPLAHVKLPVLKLVFTLESFNVSMVQGLQWFLRTRFSPLLSQQEEQQSSSVFQINTSLDTCESLNNPCRIYFVSQSVLALGFTGPSRAREQIPETGIWDGGKDSRMLPRTGGTALAAMLPRGTTCSRVLLEGVGRNWIPAGEGSFLLTRKEGFIKTHLTAELQSRRPARANNGKLMQLTGSKDLDDSARNGPSDVLMHFKRKSS